MSAEQWRAIAGYEGLYVVSDRGRVRSLDRFVRGRRYRGRLLKSSRLNNSAGHLYVGLSRDSKVRHPLVHQLVLEAFVGSCPPGMEGCHINDVATDNRLANLKWGTRSDNLRDAVRNGKHGMANRTHCPKGHEYTAANTLIDSQGGRVCRACVRLRSREERRKERLMQRIRYAVAQK